MSFAENETPYDKTNTGIEKETVSGFNSKINNNYKKIGNYILSKINVIIAQTIGEGTFGKVKIGIHILTNQKVAIKMLEKDKIVDKSDIERVAREIHILKLMRHQNIVHLYDTISSRKHIYLIMEYVEGGDLFDYICRFKKIDETQACYIYQQLLSTIEYIHKMGIVHRDLKPENILLDEQNRIKLVDFGLSNTYKHGSLVKTACGSPCYAAPEMISGKSYNGLGSDLWSSGVVLYCMLCGFLPFDEEDIKSLYKKITTGNYRIPSFVSDQASDLLRNILQVQTNKRYNLEQIKQHPWFNKVKQTLDEGIFIGINEVKYEEDIVNKVMTLTKQDNKEEIINSIKNNNHNNYTTCYYLLLKRRNLKSLSKPKKLFETPKDYSEKDINQNKSVEKENLKTEFHNKIITIPNNIATPEQLNKNKQKKIDLNINKKITIENKVTNPTRNLQEKLQLTSCEVSNKNNTIKNIKNNNLKLFRTSNKFKPSLNQSINNSYYIQKLDSTFIKKNDNKILNPIQISLNQVTSKKINFMRPNSLITKIPNNDSIYLQYSKLNDSLIKDKYEKKSKNNCSKVRKILNGQSYNLENSSLYFVPGKDLSHVSESTSTKHSNKNSNNIISLRQKNYYSVNKTFNMVKCIDLSPKNIYSKDKKEKLFHCSNQNDIKLRTNKINTSLDKKTISNLKSIYKPAFLQNNTNKIKFQIPKIKNSFNKTKIMNGSKILENDISFIGNLGKTNEK